MSDRLKKFVNKAKRLSVDGKRIIIHASIMCLLIIVMLFSLLRLFKDYKEIEDKPQDNLRVSVATTGAVTVTPTSDPETQVIVSLNYITETITISKGSRNSTKFYISQDKQKTWEVIDNVNGKLDLTIFMKTSDHVLFIKGDKDKKVVEVKIPKEDGSLKVNYSVEAGVGKLNFTNAVGSLEYRKGANGAWKVYSGTLDLSDYEINGYTLQFRTMASVSARAGKIVNVKIPKRQTPPTIKVDYSKYALSGMKTGETQYRIAGSGTWITFEEKKIKTLDLSKILLPKDASPNTLPIPAATLEFRNIGTDKKVASGIRIVEVLEQPVAPNETNIKLNTNKISFLDASSSKPYEYVVLHTKEEVDMMTAKWKKVTSPKEITISKVGSASTVPGDVVYYRLASSKDKDTKDIIPASMYSSIVITSIVVPNDKP